MFWFGVDLKKFHIKSGGRWITAFASYLNVNNVFEPTCAHARCALRRPLLSVCLSFRLPVCQSVTNTRKKVTCKKVISQDPFDLGSPNFVGGGHGPYLGCV